MGDGDEFSAKRARIDEAAVLSEGEILRLVAQREQHRQARRFADSDAIREELRQHGVELFDKEKEWRAKDGRRGTLFTAGPAECVLSDAEIQDRIAAREDARKNKDFELSDQLRDDLRQLGVELVDREGIWRTGSGRSGSYTGATKALSSMDTNMIKAMVADRERFRAMQDFDAADDMRRQLLAMGVELFDNDRIWRASDGQTGVIITGGQQDACTFSEDDIVTRVAKREQARAAKSWQVADSIRDELRRNGVELLDNSKTWCAADGRQGSYAAAAAWILGGGPPMGNELHTQARKPSGAPVAAAAAPALCFCEASINALVLGRERARERHDWEVADAIRMDLRSHGVEVWDREKYWQASDGRSGYYPQLR